MEAKVPVIEGPEDYVALYRQLLDPVIQNIFCTPPTRLQKQFIPLDQSNTRSRRNIGAKYVVLGIQQQLKWKRTTISFDLEGISLATMKHIRSQLVTETPIIDLAPHSVMVSSFGRWKVVVLCTDYPTVCEWLDKNLANLVQQLEPSKAVPVDTAGIQIRRRENRAALNIANIDKLNAWSKTLKFDTPSQPSQILQRPVHKTSISPAVWDGIQYGSRCTKIFTTWMKQSVCCSIGDAEEERIGAKVKI